MFCPNCGEKIPDGSKYCEFCGTKLYNVSGAQHSEVRHDPDAPQTYAAQPKKKRGCMIGCLISALIVGLVIAVIGFIVFRSVWNMDVFNTTDLSEDEYKAVCREYTYEEIMSESETLRGEMVIVIEGGSVEVVGSRLGSIAGSSSVGGRSLGAATAGGQTECGDTAQAGSEGLTTVEHEIVEVLHGYSSLVVPACCRQLCPYHCSNPIMGL